MLDLVLCKHPNDNRVFLFRAPMNSGLQEGDDVICDTRRGENPAKVIQVCTVSENSSIYEMIKAATGAHGELKRILYKQERIPMNYPEDVVVDVADIGDPADELFNVEAPNTVEFLPLD